MNDDKITPLSEEARELAKAKVAILKSSDTKPNGAVVNEKKRQSQASQLVEIASEAELFHTSMDDPYATVTIDGHRETYFLRETNFKNWLLKKFYERHKTAPSAQGYQDARAVLESKAKFEGPERGVFTRVAPRGDAVYIDLADKDWRAVKVTKDGWRVMPNPRVRFRRPRGMLPLPPPKRGFSINDLRESMNLGQANDWFVIVSWLVGALNPQGPYSVLVLNGG